MADSKENDTLWQAYCANRAYDAILVGKEIEIGDKKTTIGGISFYKERMADHAKALADAQTVLDQGSGTGNLAMLLALQGKNVIANDTNPYMAEHLTEKMQERKADLIEAGGLITTIKQDANTTTIPLTVEGAASNNVLYLPTIHPDKFLGSLYAAIKEGGTLVLSSFLPEPDMDEVIAAGREELESRVVTLEDGSEKTEFELLAPEVETVIQINKVLATMMTNTYTPDGIEALLRKHSFQPGEIIEDYAGHGFTAIAKKE